MPPGLARPTAVAVDRTADIRAELAEVLRAIDEVEDEADRLAAEARLHALEGAAVADRQAVRLLAEARDRCPAERARILAEHSRDRERESQALLAGATDEARRIGRVSIARAQALVETVLRGVRAAYD